MTSRTTPTTSITWVLDSGGAGRGAWQGGVLHEVMRWAREHGSYPQVSMGASAGGYAAADVATGTERTVMKGWTAWGDPSYPARFPLDARLAHEWPASTFRRHLHASIRYVMGPEELDGVFGTDPARKLLVFTARIRRRDGRPLDRRDLGRLLVMAATRKLPRALKYLPDLYVRDPVIFASPLPPALASEFVRPLTPRNYHSVIEASCVVPIVMGPPLPPPLVNDGGTMWPGDEHAIFVDGGYALKMPMAMFEEDGRFRALARWAATDRTVVFCCDPKGRLWETSLRLRTIDDHPSVTRARASDRLLVIHPDHRVEAGFLCFDPPTIMRTFERGRAQARRLLASERVRRFLSGASVDPSAPRP